MKVVRTRPAPNFTLSLKINLCDLGDLCVINSPVPEAKAGAFAYVGPLAHPQNAAGTPSL